MPDKYALVRPYLDKVLQPDPYFMGNGSHGVLLSLSQTHGHDLINALIDKYFAEMGENGQRDPHNKWNKI